MWPERSRDSPGLTFFTVLREKALQFLLPERIDNNGSIAFLTLIHPHIEGLVRSETESAGRFIELVRRHSQIEQDPRDGPDSVPVENRCKIPEVVVNKRYLLSKTAQPPPGEGQGLCIGVDAHQTSGCAEPPEECLGMPASPERGVDIHTIRFGNEREENVLEENRRMICLCGHRQAFFFRTSSATVS